MTILNRLRIALGRPALNLSDRDLSRLLDRHELPRRAAQRKLDALADDAECYGLDLWFTPSAVVGGIIVEGRTPARVR